jgi:predicted secreted Zn-dependent protease
MRNLRLCALLWVGICANGALFALPEIRDCETEHYDITGESGDDLLAEMKLKNETKGGYFAHTRYNYKNKCKELNTTCKVRLPRWAEFTLGKCRAEAKMGKILCRTRRTRAGAMWISSTKA